MPSLHGLESRGSYKQWNYGANIYQINTRKKDTERNRTILVDIKFGKLPIEHNVLLDTGAWWSILDEETQQLLDLRSGYRKKTVSYSTSHGLILGNLVRLDITFISRVDWGNDLTVEGSFFVTDEWPGPNIIGYRGLLDHMRIALEPSYKDENNIFYFASSYDEARDE